MSGLCSGLAARGVSVVSVRRELSSWMSSSASSRMQRSEGIHSEEGCRGWGDGRGQVVVDDDENQ